MLRRLKALVFVLVGLVVVTAVVMVAVKVLPGSVFGSEFESRDSQVITAISREEQVVLLSLGIQGISEKNGKSTFLGVDVPGSDRVSLLQYGFNAKLGVEGKDVQIVENGENAYTVTVPEFIFIGHSNESFRLVAQDNGVLSFVTPEIDDVEMINTILNGDAQVQYIESNQEILRDQAKAFYAGIIHSVDPTIEVSFEFR